MASHEAIPKTVEGWMKCQEKKRQKIRDRWLTPEVTIELSRLSCSAHGGGSGGHLVWRSKAGEIGAVSKGMMDGAREMAFGRKDHSREPWSRLRISREISPRVEV